jgi:hypothetical protein
MEILEKLAIAKTEAMELWIDLIEQTKGYPYIPSECGGDLYCYFCGADLIETHEKDCVYVKAKTMIGSLSEDIKKVLEIKCG